MKIIHLYLSICTTAFSITEIESTLKFNTFYASVSFQITKCFISIYQCFDFLRGLEKKIKQKMHILW